MARTKKSSETAEAEFIKPLIKVAGEKHLLEEMHEEGEMPVLKSVGYTKLGGGKHSWVSYTMTTKGKEVLSIEIDEPNMRAIAEESAKTAFVTNFQDQEAPL